MKVLFAASEAVPFCKTGGLADVVGALPSALGRLGVQVTLFLPCYREVKTEGLALRSAGKVRVPIDGEDIEAELLCTEINEAVVCLVSCPRYYDREGIYGGRAGGFGDNAQRYAFFSRAVLEGARHLGRVPDVIHCHDWQTGLIPVYLKTLYSRDKDLGGIGTILTIHNLAYQGNFDYGALAAAGLPPALFADERLKHYNQVSYLKGGIVYADVVNTVSPTYAEEIQTKAFGCGLESTVRARRADLHGVLNGLNLELWDPAADQALVRRYRREDFPEGKAAGKAALQKECGFAPSPRAPLLSSVTRLDYQKGLDAVLEVLPGLMENGAQYVIAGTGDPELERKFREIVGRFPGKVHYDGTFEEPFARRAYAGADMFLMPSRFEPCGLGQMIAMRYGTLPVAVRTGGLADTVLPHGFLAGAATAAALSAALAEALRCYQDEEGWRLRVDAAMARNFAWDPSAAKYLELYRTAAQRNGPAA
ncbi:MAG: glycogen synthase [Elusimicrobiota bacterium]